MFSNVLGGNDRKTGERKKKKEEKGKNSTIWKGVMRGVGVEKASSCWNATYGERWGGGIIIMMIEE